MANLPKMRTIKQCAEHFKAEDPETRVSEHYVRLLVKQRKIPVYLAGSRQLVNLDVLISFLNSDYIIEELVSVDYGKLRKVEG